MVDTDAIEILVCEYVSEICLGGFNNYMTADELAECITKLVVSCFATVDADLVDEVGRAVSMQLLTVKCRSKQ